MRINTNLIAGNAQRNLGITSGKLGKNVEKLSSGLRINRAADDAAGLSISEKMRSQIRGLHMASKNGQDGISLIQSAEGALGESHEILQRIRELTVQAANGINENEDVEAIQSEIDQLVDELDRIGRSTEFNGKNLLNGNLSESADTAATTFKTAKEDWDTAKAEAKAFEKLLAEEKKKIEDIIAQAEGKEAKKAGTEATNLQASFDKLAAQVEKLEKGGDAKLDIEDNVQFDIGAGTTADTLHKAIDDAVANKDTTTTGDQVVANAKALLKEAEKIMGQVNDALKVNRGKWEEDKSTYDAAAVTERAALSKNKMSLQVGANQGQRIEFNVTDMTISSDNVTGTTNSAMLSLSDLTSKELGITHDYDYALGLVDDAIKAVSEARSGLGAIQNRLEHTIKNVDTVAENLTSAESRIRDVDMASEMVEFTNNNIKTQAATAMLAQANTLPQTVLQLLG